MAVERILRRWGGRPSTDRAVGLVTVLMVLVAALILGSVSAAAATSGTVPAPTIAVQLQSDPEDEVQILGVDQSGPDVVIDIAVPPSIGRLAPTAQNFEVADGGQLVDLTVAPAGTAADIVLVIDTSGSMQGSAIAAAKASAGRFLDAAAGEARIGLVSFGDEVVTHAAPTLDRAGVRAELAALEATGQETVLWDALLVAAETLEGSPDGRSSVVVLTDGDDTASEAAPADVIGRFGGGGAALYAVAIESPDTDLGALDDAVAGIGGLFLPTTDIGELDAVYTDIAGRLANRYRLRFAPAVTGERTVVISVAAEAGLVTARTVIGDGTGPLDGPAGPTSQAPGAGPPPVLNIGDEPVLGLVTTAPLGRLGSPISRWVGLSSVFAALTLVGILLVRPRTPIRINAAASADRIGGVNVRLGRIADRLISRHDPTRRIDRRLEAADINVRPGEFVLVMLLLTGAIAMVVGVTSGFGPALMTVAGATLVAHLLLKVRAGRRQDRFAEQLTETLGIMASSLRAGQSLPKAIELVASEAPSPTAEQFHRIAFEVRVGRDLTESIRDAAERMKNPDLEWLAQAVDINRALGGDLTEIIDNVAATIRERRTVARKVEALSAEGRATGWILLAMPVLLFLFSWWRTPDNIETLLTEPLGQVLLGIAATGMVIGHFWIRKLVKVSF